MERRRIVNCCRSCPGSERNHTKVRVPNEIIQMAGFGIFTPCPIVFAASGICVGAAGVALKCHLKGESGHHLLTKCRKGDLVVKCHLKAKRAHPWLAERRKGDLVVRGHLAATSCHPWPAKRCREDLVVKCQLKPKNGHPWPAKRCREDLVVKFFFVGLWAPR